MLKDLILLGFSFLKEGYLIVKPWVAPVFGAVLLTLTLINVKSLPLVYHVRFARALLNYFLMPKPAPGKGPNQLFSPIITTSRAPLMECDMNGHKSNSTYFSDADVSRAQLLACLLAVGKKEKKKGPRSGKKQGGGGKGGKLPAFLLGGVQCSFRREIKPYQPYEIWTRVLSWDGKWLYLISYFIEKNRVQPKTYHVNKTAPTALKKKGTQSPSKGPVRFVDPVLEAESTDNLPRRAIFATSVARYVIKKGRMTLPPALLLHGIGLLHEQPEMKTASETGCVYPEGFEVKEAGETGLTPPPSPPLRGEEAKKETPKNEDDWTTARIEEARVNGLKVASLLAGWEAGHETFAGPEHVAVERFWDF